MGVREWLKRRMGGYDGREQLPARASAMYAMFGDGERPPHALGEYDARSYPADLAEQLRRREEVTAAILEMDLTTASGRVAATPRLQALLRSYPHPLLYEALLHAYADAGRWDDARGVAYAARARRTECERSPFPEIRSETDRLRDWTPEDVEELRRERGGASASG